MADAAKQQSNPFSTGGGGHSFETRVQAAFTVLMLTGADAPCLPKGPITRIKLQGKYAGFNTDDCIVFTQDADTGRQAKLLAQIKHAISFTEGNEVFAEVISAAWSDFNNQEILTEGVDAIALITGPLSVTDRNNVRPLLEWARYCADAHEFITKANTPKFSSDAKQHKLAAIRAQLTSANGGTGITDEILWRFLKGFYLIGYDLDSASGSTLSLLKSLLALSIGDQADGIWSRIVDFVQSADQGAGTIVAENIPDNIRSCFSARPTRDWNRDLQKLHDHGDYILEAIRDDIGGVHIERRELVCQLTDLAENSEFVLVSGGRGCGKSTIVREFAKFAQECHPVFCLRTEDLNQPHLDQVFSFMGLSSSLSELGSAFAMMPKRYLLIESLEKLLELQHKTAFADLVHFLRKHPGWTVIASIRDYAYSQITRNLLPPDVRWSSLTIPEFGDSELGELCNKIPALRPLADNPEIACLIKNPFLADLAARVVATGTRFSGGDGEEVFRTAVWRDVIAKEQDRANGMPPKRRRAFIDIAVKRAKAMAYGVPESGFNLETSLSLEADHLVRRDLDKGLVSPAHDVLEDWALDAFIDETFEQTKKNLSGFLNAIGPEPALNRAFRLWLHRKLRSADMASGARDLVLEMLGDASIETYWQDEAIAAVLMSDDPLAFLEGLGDRLFENNGALIKRFCFILRIACKVPVGDFIRQESSSDSAASEGLYLQPSGSGWAAIIAFLERNRDRVKEDLLPHVTPLLDDWASVIHIAEDLPGRAYEAGLLALHLLEMVKDVYRAESITKKLFGVIFRTLPAIEAEFRQLLDRDVFVDQRRRLPYVDDLLPMALEDFDTAWLCKQAPDLVIRLAQQEWFFEEDPDGNQWGHYPGVEECFGLHQFKEGAQFFPASGMKGPFAPLLRWHPRVGLDFIVSLCNQAAEKYAHSRLDKVDRGEERSLPAFLIPGGVSLVEIPLNDGTRVKQYCSDRLWCGYRGTQVLPYLLQSTLMALENWLITVAENWSDDSVIEWIIDHILRHSNSVMTTAVVASVATGFPERLGTAALPLLKAPELYELDLTRYVSEAGALGFGFDTSPFRELYNEERKLANNRSWRKEHLETLAIRLQLTSLRDGILEILDQIRVSLPESGTQDERTTNWRFRLHRMDTRTWEAHADEQENRVFFVPKDIEPDLQELQDQTQSKHATYHRFMALFLWADSMLKHESPEFEHFRNWDEALDEAKSLMELLRTGDVDNLSLMHVGAVVKAAAVFLRDHSTDLAEEDAAWCAQLVVESVHSNADTDNTTLQVDESGLDGAPAAARVLPILLDFVGDAGDRRQVRRTIATAFTHANGAVRHAAAEGIKDHLWQRDPDFAQACVDGAMEFARLSLEATRNHQWDIEAQRWRDPTRETWLCDLRERIVVDRVDPAPANASFESHSAWHILAPCLMVPEGSAAPEHISLISRLLLLVLEHEKHEGRRHTGSDYTRIPAELTVHFPMRLADHLMGIPQEHAADYLDVLVTRCGSAPKFISSLLVYLSAVADKRQAFERYWWLWSQLAMAVKKVATELAAVDTERLSYDDRSRLIQRMLLADTPWQGTAEEQELLIPGLDLIFDFADTAGTNPLVFKAMTRLMFCFPGLFMPKTLLMLASHQQTVEGTRLMGGTDTVFYLEHVLQRFLVLNPDQSSISHELRSASLMLLNAMIETGSSRAYFLRDYLLHSLCSR